MHDQGWILTEWHRYLRRREYCRATVTTRVTIARAWIVEVDEWPSATFRQVEAWTDTLEVTARVRRNYVSHLRAFYRWAAREGLASQDPTALVESPKCPQTLPRPARDRDIAMVLAGAPAQLAAMVGLMSVEGLRCCEVSALTWDDVDLHWGDEAEQWAGTIFVMGKGSKERRIELSPEVVELLVRLETTEGHVFVSARGRPYTPNRISQIVNSAFRELGLITQAHQLRHRAGTKAVQLPGADILAVRDFMGHASVATTQIYTKVAAGLAGAVSRSIPFPV